MPGEGGRRCGSEISEHLGRGGLNSQHGSQPHGQMRQDGKRREKIKRITFKGPSLILRFFSYLVAS